MNNSRCLLVMSLAASISGFAFSCKSTEMEAVKENIKVLRPVRFEQARFASGTVERKIAGVTRAAIQTNVSFRVGGKVTGVSVRMGDTVKEDQTLAVLDDGDLRLRLQQAMAQQISTQAQADNAKAHYERTRALYVNKNASLAELDAARSRNRSAEANVVAGQQQVELARSQLRQATLSASGSGTIGQVFIDKGEVVGAGQPAMVFASTGFLEVEVFVPELYVRNVAQKDTVKIYLDAFPERPLTGIVEEVGVIPVELGTTYPVTIGLLQDDEDWRPGMAAEVIFNISTGVTNNRLVVPSMSVGEDSNGKYVFVLEEIQNGIGKANRSQVQVGGFLDGGIEILSGLGGTDFVVTAGVNKLQDGQQVRVLGL